MVQKIFTPDPVNERRRSRRNSDEHKKLETFGRTRIIQLIKTFAQRFNVIDRQLAAYGSILSGSCILKLSSEAVNISASELNNAPADTFKQTFVVSIRTLDGQCPSFIKTDGLVLTPSEAVSNPLIGLPVITGQPVIKKGRAIVEITFPTDEGSTLIYQADDTISVSCDLTLAGIVLPQSTIIWTVI